MHKVNMLLVIMASLMFSSVSFAGEVNINTANAETIASELKGVGLSKARAIVEYREENGDFDSADELTLVKGIGLKTIDHNRENIKVRTK